MKKIIGLNLFLVFVLSFVIVSIFSSDCHCKENSRKEEPVFVYVKQEQVHPPGEHHKFQRGMPSRVVFAVENKTNDFIILRRFDIDSQLRDIDRWYGSAYGSAEYRPLEDIWKYNGMFQCLSKAVFVRGLIAPGAELEVVRNVIFRDENIKPDISYQRLSKEQLAKQVYFNTGQGSDVNRIFRHIEDINSLLANRDTVDWSFAVFPEADKFAIDKQQALCSVDLSEPEFNLELAKKKLEQEIYDFVFWKDKGAWVLKAEKGNYFVDKENVVELGDINLLAFVLIEFSGDKINFVLPLKGYELFNPQKPKIEGPGYFNPGVTAISKEKIMELFKFAKSHGDAISVLVYDPSGLGGNFYLLVGEFDEKLRRTIAEDERAKP